MENALLIGLSRQMALQRRMDVIANNMANVNTAGFKADSVQFEEYLMPVAEIIPQSGSDARLSYVQDSYQIKNFNEGSFHQTGNEFDVAISGEGFLVAQTPDGERYTRNGQLKLNNEGVIVTSEGYPVLGEGGPITISTDDANFTIGKDGTISTSQGQKDRFRLVRFENPQMLTKQGTTLFAAEEPALPAENAELHQGKYEGSNVQAISEMSRMIETMRAYTTTAQMLDNAAKLRRDAINQLAGQQA